MMSKWKAAKDIQYWTFWKYWSCRNQRKNRRRWEGDWLLTKLNLKFWSKEKRGNYDAIGWGGWKRIIVAALSWNQIGSFGAGFAKSKDDGLNRESKEQFSCLPTVSKITIECWRILTQDFLSMSQRTVLDVVGGSDDVGEQLLSHVPDFSCWTK